MAQIIGYCLLGLFGILLFILLVPVYAHVMFHEDLQLKVCVLGIPVFRYPGAEKSIEKAAETPSESEGLSALALRLKTDGVAATVSLVKQTAELAIGAARRILAAITVDKLYLQLVVTGDDAAKVAETTGGVCAVLYPAITAIQQTVLRIRRRSVTVTPDFLGTNGRVEAEVTAHVVPLRLLMIFLWIWYQNKRNKEVSQHGEQGTESHGAFH